MRARTRVRQPDADDERGVLLEMFPSPWKAFLVSDDLSPMEGKKTAEGETSVPPSHKLPGFPLTRQVSCTSFFDYFWVLLESKKFLMIPLI